mmetsp:Transcript_35292/g.88255  ORF Transcript_35292/g.88255 Transcript_35292/m.88255 type:complete len:298 (+) Transcript_35292:4028-4921(+)
MRETLPFHPELHHLHLVQCAFPLIQHSIDFVGVRRLYKLLRTGFHGTHLLSHRCVLTLLLGRVVVIVVRIVVVGICVGVGISGSPEIIRVGVTVGVCLPINLHIASPGFAHGKIRGRIKLRLLCIFLLLGCRFGLASLALRNRCGTLFGHGTPYHLLLLGIAKAFVVRYLVVLRFFVLVLRLGTAGFFVGSLELLVSSLENHPLERMVLKPCVGGIFFILLLHLFILLLFVRVLLLLLCLRFGLFDEAHILVLASSDVSLHGLPQKSSHLALSLALLVRWSPSHAITKTRLDNSSLP